VKLRRVTVRPKWIEYWWVEFRDVCVKVGAEADGLIVSAPRQFLQLVGKRVGRVPNSHGVRSCDGRGANATGRGLSELTSA
jgi:hypothetical protein